MVGGYPIPGLDGGYPIPGLDQGGYPHLRSGREVSHSADGGYPHLRSGWGIPHSAYRGVPYSRSEWGYPSLPPSAGWGTPPVRRQISIASTCYTAGGVPLAFTQEDFLLNSVFESRFS